LFIFLPAQENEPKESAPVTSPSGAPALRDRGRTRRNSLAWRRAQTAAASLSPAAPMHRPR